MVDHHERVHWLGFETNKSNTVEESWDLLWPNRKPTLAFYQRHILLTTYTVGVSEWMECKKRWLFLSPSQTGTKYIGGDQSLSFEVALCHTIYFSPSQMAQASPPPFTLLTVLPHRPRLLLLLLLPPYYWSRWPLSVELLSWWSFW